MLKMKKKPLKIKKNKKQPSSAAYFDSACKYHLYLNELIHVFGKMERSQG